MNCTPRKSVALIGLPPGFLDNLPQDDRQALLDAVGKKVRFNGYDEHGRAELEFMDKNGVWHFIYLDPKLNWYTGTD
jgi:hypothetical protein